MVDHRLIRGFGRALVQAALERGNSVVATARRPEQLQDFVAAHPHDVLALPLDVTDARAVKLAIRTGVERFGRIDVLVNNAGYANVAPIETGDDADFRTQFETNFWGVYNVSKAAIPQLRTQGGGTIVQFSSIGGRVGGSSGIASYQTAKFAVDGFSRVLATETAPFGIRVMVVEPSGFATDWAGTSMRVDRVPAESGDGWRHEQPPRSRHACGRPEACRGDHRAGHRKAACALPSTGRCERGHDGTGLLATTARRSHGMVRGKPLSRLR